MRMIDKMRNKTIFFEDDGHNKENWGSPVDDDINDNDDDNHDDNPGSPMEVDDDLMLTMMIVY